MERTNQWAFAVHPGAIIETDLGRTMSTDELAAAVERAKDGGFKTVEQGAATTIWCAVSPQLDGKGGVYCEDVDVARIVPAGSPELFGVRPYACDPELAERLWQKSGE